MAALTTTRSGDWSNTTGGVTPWTALTGSGTGGVPGAGDTVTIATGHTVTLSSNVSIGTSPATDTDWQLDVVGTGVLSIGGYSITVLGSIRVGDGSSGSLDRIIGTAGSAVKIDGTATPGTMYLIQFGSAAAAYNARCGLNLTGTSGSRCTLACIGGSAKMLGAEIYRYRSLKLKYTDISGWGSATVNAVTLDSNYFAPDTADTSGIELSNCVVNNCGHFRIAVRGTNPLLQDTEFTNSLQNLANGYQSIQFSSSLSTSAGIIRRCDFDRQVLVAGTSTEGWTIENIVARAGLWTTSTAPPTTGVNNILAYLDGPTNAAIGSASSCKVAGSWNKIYCLSDLTADPTHWNPHKLNIAGPAIPFALDTVICDARGYEFVTDTGDLLDAFAVTTSSTANKVLILPAVFTNGASAIDASGSMWWGTATASAKLTITHSTVYSPNASSGIQYPHGVNNAANTGKVQSSLFWANAATGSNYAVRYDYSVQVNDVLALADGFQYNATWNMSTGSNTVVATPTNYVGLSGNKWSAAPTLNTNIDLVSSPAFVDVTRNFWTWSSTVLGSTGTSDQIRDAGIAAIKADWTKFSGTSTSLIEWVMAGFAPTNPVLQNAGHDGTTIGAVEYTSGSSTAGRGIGSRHWRFRRLRTVRAPVRQAH